MADEYRRKSSLNPSFTDLSVRKHTGLASDTAWRISACTRSPPPTDQNGKKKNKFLLRKFQTMTGYFKSARRFPSFLFSVEKRPMWMRISQIGRATCRERVCQYV